MPLRHRVVMLATLMSLVVSLVFATTGAPASLDVTDDTTAAAAAQDESGDVARAADAGETGQAARRDASAREQRKNRREFAELPSTTTPPAVTQPPGTPPPPSTTVPPSTTTTTQAPPSTTTTTTQAPPPSTTTTTHAPPSTTTTTQAPPPPPTTTTTTAPPVTQPPTGSTVGIVGCSNTAQGVAGAEMVTADTGLWSFTDVGMPGVEGGIGGGSLEKWADPAEGYWDYLDTMSLIHPNTDTIWFQICIRAAARVGAGANATAEEFGDASFIVSEIKKRFPSATVYVSPLNDYKNGHVCSGTGEYGVAVATELTDYLAGSGAALRGPIMSALAVSDTMDGCHAADGFLPNWGSDLLGFFG